jgi:hypothetical protein
LNYSNYLKLLKLSFFYLFLPLILGINSAFGWTEPKIISGDSYPISPRAVALGRSLHVVAHQDPDFFYMKSWNNGFSWLAPINIAGGHEGGSSRPDIIESKGKLHVVFTAMVPDSYQRQIIHISSTDDGQTWSDWHQVFNNNEPGMYYQRLAANGDTLFISCIRYPYLLAFRSFDAGESWSDSFIVEDTASSINSEPVILYSDSRLHLIYQAYYGTGAIDIFYRFSSDLGQTWADRELLATADDHDGQFPSAAADNNGDVAVFWFDYKYGSYCGFSGDILGRVSTDNGDSWGPECRLTTTQSGEASSCIILNGVIHVAFMDDWPLGCLYPKISYCKSTDWGDSWSQPENISGEEQLSFNEPCLFYSFGHNIRDTLLHCAVYSIPNVGLSKIYYFRNEPFLSDRWIPDNGWSTPEMLSIRAYPSVFNMVVTIEYENRNGSEARLSIYNILGQEIKTILKGKEERGEIFWDGTDEGGNKVASGVYFLHLSASNSSRVAKVTYIR